ncbi:MAG: RNA-binding cell elongation regulator Jag/EloR [Oscillospiraceae bacterium]
MAKISKVVTAKSVEEAKALAAEEFGASLDEISFVVLEEPKKGLFGKTKGDARVEATYEETKTKVAQKYIIGVFTAMGVENVKIDASDIENGVLLNVSGDGLEELIGKKGELLDAVQYLASLIANRLDKEYFRISTDCGNFRERRKAVLEELAKKIAAGVKKTGRSSTLEPMNPYERRIIHAAVSELEGVSSRSVGEEPYRKVIISSTSPRPERGAGGFNKGGKGGGFNKGGPGGKPRGERREQTPRKSFDIKTSFEKDYKKPKPEDNLPSGLYSKIEF